VESYNFLEDFLGNETFFFSSQFNLLTPTQKICINQMCFH